MRHSSRFSGGSQHSKHDRPEISLALDEHEVLDRAILALGHLETLYRRGGRLVSLRAGGHEPAPLDPHRLVAELSRAARWTLPRARAPQRPTLRHARAVLGSPDLWAPIRPLAGVTTCPVLRPDGSVLDRPGYDPETQLVYAPSVEYPAVPATPDKDTAVAAIEDLCEVLDDFPFDSGASRSAWLAALLTVVARPAIAGPSPMLVITSPTRGSGKTLLAHTLAMIVTGEYAYTLAPVSENAEWRKQITMVARAVRPIAVVDNVGQRLGSTALDSALTTTRWSDRVLGQSRDVSLSLTTTWIVTGNNVQYRGDTARRCIQCLLAPDEEHPERRSGFAYPDLMYWVSSERPRLLVAALTALRGWYAAGEPDMGLPTYGSYEAWSRVIRNTLVWAGHADPAETQHKLMQGDEGEPDRESARLLIRGLDHMVRQCGRPLITREIIEQLGRDKDSHTHMRDAIAHIKSGDSRTMSPRLLGYYLRSYRGRVIDGRKIDHTHKLHGNVWFVRSVEPTPKA